MPKLQMSGNIFLRLKGAVAKQWTAITHNQNFKIFGPIVVLMAGGTYFLQVSQNVKFERVKRQQRLDQTADLVDKCKKRGYADADIDSKEDLEALQKDIVKEMDLESYENIRGPREWEEGTVERVQEAYKKRMAEKEQRKAKLQSSPV